MTREEHQAAIDAAKAQLKIIYHLDGFVSEAVSNYCFENKIELTDAARTYLNHAASKLTTTLEEPFEEKISEHKSAISDMDDAEADSRFEAIGSEPSSIFDRT